jgi:acetyl esterase/lipase
MRSEETTMPLDPDAAQALELVRLSGRPSFDQVSPAEARELFLGGRKVFDPEPMAVAEIRELKVPGPAGGTIPARLYRAAGSEPGAALPALLYFHGGGWVVGTLDTHDTLCRRLANGARCAVVSVDYRLAPEHKFPAAVEDALAATRWVEAAAGELAIDPGRIAVGGDSAGGNLAAAVSLLARDAGGPRLLFQLLIYPAVDAAMAALSQERFAEGYLLTRATMRWFYDHYLNRPADAADWRASPLAAPDLSGLPSAYIVTAGYDPLSDEGVSYARRLAQSGVRVTHRHFPDQLHGFFTMGKVIRAALPAADEAAAALRAAFAAQPSR